MVIIDWPKPKILVGIAQDGVVYFSTDGGGSWTSRGTVPGQPAALEVTGSGWCVASEQGLFKSSDDGATWAPIGPRIENGR